MLLDEQIEVARDSGQYPCPFPFNDIAECVQRAGLHDVDDPENFCRLWHEACGGG